MKSWQFAVVGAIVGSLVALAGCRNDPSIALLERDNRLKENEIYRLRSRLEELEEAVQASAPAATTSTTPSDARRPRAATSGELPPEPRVEGGSTSPRSDATIPRSMQRDSPPPDTFRPPKIELPGEAMPDVPNSLKVPGGGEAPRRVPAPGGNSQSAPTSGLTLASGQAAIDASPVAQITLNPSLTGGINNGGRDGDEGLLIVVEPRDFRGNIVDLPGDISIALLDPALVGEQSRLARWDFTAAETAGMIRTGTQRGVHLQVPWKSAVPTHDRLKLYVRYTTGDGRKLQTDRLIGVALHSPLSVENAIQSEAETPDKSSRSQRPEWSPVR